MPQMRRINPRVDFAFKLIFQQNKDLLIDLINSVVSQKDQVSDIDIQNPYSLKRRSGDKLTILDIKAKSVEGVWFNVEVQVADDLHYDKRTLYYLCRLYSEQIGEGQPYGDLSKAISINILNFNILDEKAYHNVYRIKHDKTNKPFNDLLELHYIELQKIPDDLRKIKTSLDRWTVLLAKGERFTEETLPEPLKKDKMIRKAMSVFETTRFDDQTWMLYEARLKWLRDEASAIDTAEVRAREQIARNLKDKGMDVTAISEVTGLSGPDIKGL